MPHPRSSAALMVTALFLAGCGGSDSPTDPGGGGGNPPPDSRTIVDNPSFSGVVMEIFNRKGCTASGCHGTGQGGLTLTDAATSHANLVGVVSPTSGQVRVVAGNAAESYLITKLSPNPPFGDQMPQGGSPLDNIDMTNIRNWINQGAANN